MHWFTAIERIQLENPNKVFYYTISENLIMMASLLFARDVATILQNITISSGTVLLLKITREGYIMSYKIFLIV